MEFGDVAAADAVLKQEGWELDGRELYLDRAGSSGGGNRGGGRGGGRGRGNFGGGGGGDSRFKRTFILVFVQYLHVVQSIVCAVLRVSSSHGKMA